MIFNPTIDIDQLMEIITIKLDNYNNSLKKCGLTGMDLFYYMNDVSVYGPEIEHYIQSACFQQYISEDAKIRNKSRDASIEIQNKLNDIYSQDWLLDRLGIDLKISNYTEKCFVNAMKDQGLFVKSHRNRLRELNNELAELSAEYDKNHSEDIPEVNPEWKLDGVPEKSKYLIPSFINLIYKYCHDENTRKAVYFTLENRSKDNWKLLNKIRKLRHEKAQLLGYKNVAHFNRENGFLQDTKFLYEFNKLLSVKTKKILQEFTENEKEPWNIKYYQEKNKPDGKKIAQYLKTEVVLPKIINYFKEKYNMVFYENQKVWSSTENVKCYDVFERESTVNYLGRLYLDLFPRPGKFAHAAVFPLTYGDLPIYVMLCNFNKNLYKDEFLTLFHELGHAIHGLLSEKKRTYYFLGGLSTPVDFVEAPSQYLEYIGQDLLLEFGVPAELLAKDPYEPIMWQRQVFMSKMDEFYYTNPKEYSLQQYNKMWIDEYKKITGLKQYYNGIGEWSHLGDDMYNAIYYSYCITRIIAYNLYYRKVDMRRILEHGNHDGLKELIESYIGKIGSKEMIKIFVDSL